MERYDDAWVRAEVARTLGVWRECALVPPASAPRYSLREQRECERIYDQELCTVENALEDGSSGMRERVMASFGRFSARALNLEGEAIELLTRQFLPVGTGLAQWAREHDPTLEMSSIIQAARNAWTACGLQRLVGARIELTPSILGYSLLYPYSDNYLDDEEISAETKREFSGRFRCRLAGRRLDAIDDRERAMWELIGLIEAQYPRVRFPRVFECLLAIHQAQENSIGQLHSEECDDFLQLSFAKGGTSVLADACLAHGVLSGEESEFAFRWGVLLQLGDDLQDLRDDMRRGSVTLFSNAVAMGAELDGAAVQLLQFAEMVGRQMDELPHGSACLKGLLKMSWRSLIVRAVADSHEYFTRGFVREAERRSPFRFGFLRERKDRLASKRGLYETLFEAILEDGDSGESELRGLPYGRGSARTLCK